MSSEVEIELNPIDFITAGTVGPKGKRVFHLQAGSGDRLISLIMEKEQTRALGEAVTELLEDLNDRYPDTSEGIVNLANFNMNLRDPLEPLFRVAQIGLGYDEVSNQVVLVGQEFLRQTVEDDDDAAIGNLGTDDGEENPQPRVVRFWGSREQFRALSQYTAQLVNKGRADPKKNGRLIYYWT